MWVLDYLRDTAGKPLSLTLTNQPLFPQVVSLSCVVNDKVRLQTQKFKARLLPAASLTVRAARSHCTSRRGSCTRPGCCQRPPWPCVLRAPTEREGGVVARICVSRPCFFLNLFSSVFTTTFFLQYSLCFPPGYGALKEWRLSLMNQTLCDFSQWAWLQLYTVYS